MCGRGRDEHVAALSVLLYHSPRLAKQAGLLLPATLADQVSVLGTFAPDAVGAPCGLAVAVFVSLV